MMMRSAPRWGLGRGLVETETQLQRTADRTRSDRPDDCLDQLSDRAGIRCVLLGFG